MLQCDACKSVNEPWRTRCRTCGASLSRNDLGNVFLALALFLLLSPWLVFGAGGVVLSAGLGYEAWKHRAELKRRNIALARLAALFAVSFVALLLIFGTGGNLRPAPDSFLLFGFMAVGAGRDGISPGIWVVLSALVYGPLFLKLPDFVPEPSETPDNAVQEGDPSAIVSASAIGRERTNELKKLVWEDDYAVRPVVPTMEPVSDLAAIDQAHVDAYCADSRQFWKTFHGELGASISAYRAHAGKGLSSWIAMVGQTPSLTQKIALLADYPVLKGEFVVAEGGAAFLTNFRLQVLVDSALLNIPLENLVSYGLSSSPTIAYLAPGGERRELHLRGTLIVDAFVHAARDSREWTALNATQRLLLTVSRDGLSRLRPGISVPAIGVSPT